MEAPAHVEAPGGFLSSVFTGDICLEKRPGLSETAEKQTESANSRTPLFLRRHELKKHTQKKKKTTPGPQVEEKTAYLDIKTAQTRHLSVLT